MNNKKDSPDMFTTPSADERRASSSSSSKSGWDKKSSHARKQQAKKVKQQVQTEPNQPDKAEYVKKPVRAEYVKPDRAEYVKKPDEAEYDSGEHEAMKKLEIAKQMTQDAALFEARLRAELDDKRRARVKKELEEPANKKPRLTRAQKRLQDCPGVSKPSLSGRIMRQLPEIWKKEPVKQEPVKWEIQQVGNTMTVRDVTGEDGTQAGLVGHNSTFTFSPRDYENGFLKGRPDRMFFDKVPLVERLVKSEEEEAKRGPGQPQFPPASRPKPEFSEVQQETLSGTIPWETPAKTKVNDGKDTATASQHCEVLANVVVQPHHHHHLILPPAPRSCTAQMAVNSCLVPSATDASSIQLQNQMPVWVDDSAQDCRFPPMVLTHCDTAAQAAPSYKLPGPDDSDEEERFTAGMRRMVTRAQLHKKHFK